jgi:hypothetical protein
MKKIRGDKPIGVIIHTWKYHKETPYVATFISDKQKCHFILFSFFLSTKSENRKVEYVLWVGEERGSGRDWE